jgi:hypothetical protein
MGGKRTNREGWGGEVKGGGKRESQEILSSAYPAFSAQHVEESLVLMVLEEGGRNVLNCLGPSAPRPASHRDPTHGVFCPCPLLQGSGCRVRRGTSAVSKGTGSAQNHKGNKSSRGPLGALSSSLGQARALLLHLTG